MRSRINTADPSTFNTYTMSSDQRSAMPPAISNAISSSTAPLTRAVHFPSGISVFLAPAPRSCTGSRSPI